MPGNDDRRTALIVERVLNRVDPYQADFGFGTPGDFGAVTRVRAGGAI